MLGSGEEPRMKFEIKILSLSTDNRGLEWLYKLYSQTTSNTQLLSPKVRVHNF